MDNNIVYILNKDTNSVTEQNAPSTQTPSYSFTNSQAYMFVIRALFTDKSFDSVYDEDVTKTTTDTGYTLKLTLDVEGYMRLMYMSMGISDDQIESMLNAQRAALDNMPQYLKDYTDISVLISFENDNIKETKMVNNIGAYSVTSENQISYYKNDSTLIVSQYTEAIIQPQWVTDYLGQNN